MRNITTKAGIARRHVCETLTVSLSLHRGEPGQSQAASIHYRWVELVGKRESCSFDRWRGVRMGLIPRRSAPWDRHYSVPRRTLFHARLFEKARTARMKVVNYPRRSSAISCPAFRRGIVSEYHPYLPPYHERAGRLMLIISCPHAFM